MFTKVLILLLFLSISSCFAVNCTDYQVRYGKCNKEQAKDYYVMFTLPYEEYILPVIGVLVGLLPNIITGIIFIIFSCKPIQRDPTEEDIEAIQEDEADLEAKNKQYMKNMKHNLSNQKAKNQPMKEFVIKNENVNKEDDQTVPIQPAQDAASVVGQSAVTPSAASKV
uniref:Uncharacterized protein n=1 Tax=Panagrolaimus superbus TaxID=310955 RepID=A0A914YN20_9BILA